jgi:hypothetical protein
MPARSLILRKKVRIFCQSPPFIFDLILFYQFWIGQLDIFAEFIFPTWSLVWAETPGNEGLTSIFAAASHLLKTLSLRRRYTGNKVKRGRQECPP